MAAEVPAAPRSGSRLDSWRPEVSAWLLAIGGIGLTGAVFAHPLGLSRESTFGWEKLLVLLVSLGMLAVGGHLLPATLRSVTSHVTVEVGRRGFRRVPTALRRLVVVHWGFVGLLLIAVAVRVLTAVAYWPALTTADSWNYLDMAFRGNPVVAAPYPSSGYPLAIHLISLPGRSLAAIVTVQHLAGLVIGGLVYFLLVRLGTPRWAALLAAGLVLLDAVTIVLEQQVMSETLFALALIGAAVVTVSRGHHPAALALGAMLLAYAVTVRTAGLFAVPVWLVYLIWSRASARAVANAVVVLTLSLACYAFWYQQSTGTFGLSQADGWFLYGRVAAFADCRHDPVPAATRGLCDFSRLPAIRRDVGGFIWDPEAPARRAFDMFDPNVARRKHANAMLRVFAFAVIRRHPLAYARAVADDFKLYFTSNSLYYPSSADTAGFAPSELAWIKYMRQQLFPGSKEPTHTPAALSFYEHRARTPPMLLGILSGLALLAVLISSLSRARLQLPHRKESFLFTGMALAVLLGSVAVSQYEDLFVPMTAALMVCGGFLALSDFIQLATRRAQVMGNRHRDGASARPARGSAMS